MGGFNLSRGYILEIQSFSRKEQDDARVYCKRQNWWIEGGKNQGGPVGFQGALRVCTFVPTRWRRLSAQTTVVHFEHTVGRAMSWWWIQMLQQLYNTRSSQFIAFLSIHTGQKGELLPRVPNTILLVSALLWLSHGESTVSLTSYTGRHKHSLGGSSTSGFFPGPGSGSPSHLGPGLVGRQKFWTQRKGGLFTGALLPFVTDGGWW